jgi:hypothetical protein
MMLDTMSNIQEKSGRATLAYFEQLSRLPQENVKTMTRWMDSVKVTRAEFNSIMRDNYNSWNNLLGQAARHTGQTTRSFEKPKERGSEKATPHSPPPLERSAQSPPAPGHAQKAAQSLAKPEEKESKEALAQSPPPPEPAPNLHQPRGMPRKPPSCPQNPSVKAARKHSITLPNLRGVRRGSPQSLKNPGRKQTKKDQARWRPNPRSQGKSRQRKADRGPYDRSSGGEDKSKSSFGVPGD